MPEEDQHLGASYAHTDLEAAGETLPEGMPLVPVGRGSSNRLNAPEGADNPVRVSATEDRIWSDEARKGAEEKASRALEAAYEKKMKALYEKLYLLIPEGLRKENRIRDGWDVVKLLRGIRISRDAVNAAINGDSAKSARILASRREVLLMVVRAFQNTPDLEYKEFLRQILFEASPSNARRAFETLMDLGVTADELRAFYPAGKADVDPDSPDGYTSQYQAMIDRLTGLDGNGF